MPTYIGKFLKYLSTERNFSPHTVKAYEKDLEQAITFVCPQGEFSPEKISHLDLRKFMAHLRKQGYSKRTIARKIASLRSYYRYLCREGITDANPAQGLRTPRLDKRLPHFLDATEIKLLLDTPDTSDILGLRDRAILECLYSTGLRISELVGLSISDVDLIGEVLRTRGKGKKERLAPLGSYAITAIKDYMNARKKSLKPEKDRGALFLNKHGGRLSARSVNRKLDKYIAIAGLSPKTSAHTLRHTFATHMLDAGAGLREVQELLGHESLSSTQIYTHLTIERIRDVYNKTHPRAK